MMAAELSHVSRVRALYKGILKLHRGLPSEARALGDSYVKTEFRSHKDLLKGSFEVKTFLQEWTQYYVLLAKQLSSRRKRQTIGQNMSPELLDNFSDDQTMQLYDLFQEIHKPVEDVKS